MINSRRIERERILSLLYEAEIKGVSAKEVIDDLPVRPEDFVVKLVSGVSADIDQLDQAIDRHSIDWTADRMASIDRNVLRIGAWELINSPDLSVAVIISEAVELAKRFSTEESGKFVNGILSSLAEEVRAQ